MNEVQSWKRLMGFAQKSRSLIASSLLLLLGSRVVEVIVPVWLGNLMQRILDGRSTFALALQSSLWLSLWIAFSYLFDVGSTIGMRLVGERTILNIRTTLFDHVQSLSIPFFDRQRVGQLMSRTISDTEQLNTGLSQSFILIIGNAILVIGIFIGMFFVDWRIALLITLAMPLLGALTNHFRHKQKESYSQVRIALGKINTFIQEHLSGLPVIRNFGLERQEEKIFAEHNKSFRERAVDTIRHFAFFFASVDWIKSFVLILTFVGLVEFSLSGEAFRAGTFFTFSLYLLIFFRPLRMLIEQYNQFQDALASSARIFELLDTAAPKETGSKPIETITSIDFKEVTFGYSEDLTILHNVSFSVKQGQTVALVGETGAGKTTIMSLLARFYTPQSGAIQINNVDAQNFAIEGLRAQFNVVLQDPSIFSGTVFENVALFNREITEEEVISALTYVGAWEFVEHLPGGLNCQLDEKGRRLSSGQRQLISLARAVAHRGSVIVLDEATANIDSFTERAIQEALDKILAEKTTLVIAHRLSTIRNADQIIVMSKGKICEQGTHEELLSLDKYYAKLYNWQFNSGE